MSVVEVVDLVIVSETAGTTTVLEATSTTDNDGGGGSGRTTVGSVVVVVVVGMTSDAAGEALAVLGVEGIVADLSRVTDVVEEEVSFEERQQTEGEGTIDDDAGIAAGAVEGNSEGKAAKETEKERPVLGGGGGGGADFGMEAAEEDDRANDCCKDRIRKADDAQKVEGLVLG